MSKTVTRQIDFDGMRSTDLMVSAEYEKDLDTLLAEHISSQGGFTTLMEPCRRRGEGWMVLTIHIGPEDTEGGEA